MPSTPASTDLQPEIRDLWRTRPVRTPDDRKVAGVCGGFGRRYSVDPALLRVAFAATALLGGAGVCLYALAWLLLRRTGDEVSLGEALLGRGRATGSKFLALVLVVVAFLSVPTFGTGDSAFAGAGFLGLGAMLVGWYGLYKRTPLPPAGWESVTSPTATWAPPTTKSAGHAPTPPPAWDPLGVAPFAWDLPDPGTAPTPPEPKKPRSRLTSITLGLALISVAVSIGLSQIGGLSWLDAPRIGAIALAVLGVGMLVGSVLRRGHGLLVAAGPLAGFVLLSSLVTPASFGGWEKGGDLSVTVTEAAQLDSPLVHEAGTVTVDMSQLTLDRDRSYSIGNDVGEVHVTLPRDLDVRVTCRSDVGSVHCPSGLDVGGDGAGGPVLTLDVRNDVGGIEVTR